jgi:catechol 2,3-dioxygenase-like lactoylglutathione lyase family enzyme
MAETKQLVRSAPYFLVADVASSIEYYEQVLGFGAEYVAGSPPQFAILSRDGLAIMLRLAPEPDKIVPNEKQGGTWDVFFWVRDVQSLCEELRWRGADVVYGVTLQQAYHMQEFAVRDVNGYVLGFGQPVQAA